MDPKDVQEASLKSEQDSVTIVDGVPIDDPGNPDHDVAGCVSNVDSASVDPGEDEESSSKNEHNPGVTTFHMRVDVSHTSQHELTTLTGDVYSYVPKTEQDQGAVKVGAHIEAIDETEEGFTTGTSNVIVNDPSNSKEDPVSVSCNSSDLYELEPTKENRGSYEGATSMTSNLSQIVVSTPLGTSVSTKVKNVSAPKKICITAGDSQKYVKSGMESVGPTTGSKNSKQSTKITLPGNLSCGSPVVSSKLRTINPDNVLCSNKVKIKRTGPIIVRTIGPRTVRNITVCKSSDNVDPASTILITRDMDDGRMFSPVRANVITPQKATVKKHLMDAPVPSQIILRNNEQIDLTTSDNRPSQENFKNSPSHPSCNDEVLTSRQLDDELAATEDVITTDNKYKCISEIKENIASMKAVSEADDLSHDIQDGSNRSCYFCRSILTREDRITCLALNKPLPSSLLDPISLLQCLGISSPLHASTLAVDNATVILCQKCYTLVSDGDLIYHRLLSVTSEMRQHWPESDREVLKGPLGFSSHKKTLKSQLCEGLQSIQSLQSYPNTQRKCIPILPKPSMAKEFLSAQSSTVENVQVKVKQEPSDNKMRICGFCGMDLYGDEDWRLHSAAVHRVEQKWRMFNVQPTLKTLLAKEIQRSTVKQRGNKKRNWRCGNTSKRKCIACSRDFLLRDEFVEHLRHYHNMVIDEEFLSYVSEDADVMEWSNSCQSSITETPVQIKREEACIDQEEARSPITGTVEDETLQGHDSFVCKGKIEQNIMESLKQEGKEILKVEALPAPDDCHNYIGTHRSKATTSCNQGNSKKFQGPTWCCRICGKLYSSKIDLDNHKLLEHPGSMRMIKKKRMDENDSKSSPSDIHSIPLILRTKTKVNCRLCTKGFDSQEALNSHIDTFHENSVVILEKDGCGGVIDHRLDISKALDPQEENEQETTILEPQGINPNKRPDRTRSFVCNSCGDAFVNRLLLVKHKRSIHGDVCGVGGANGLVMVECEICGRRLHGIGSLRHHLSKAHNRSHRPPLKHRCKMCIYHSRTRNQLEKHMQEKHGVNVLPPVECKDCGKMYNAKYIDIHIANIHENKRKYSCNFCAMKFNIKSSLKCHISYEHANNKWHCDKCEMEFDKYHKLRQHRIYVHSTKIFPCLECGKTYKRKSDLTTHGKRRHQERIPCECTYCPKAYTDRKKLRTHLIKKHGVAWEDTLSKGYARHLRENNCLRRRQVRNLRISQNAAHSEEASGTEIQQSHYEFEKPEEVYYEEEQQGDVFYEEQYLHGHPHQNYQVQHCAQLGEGTITTYEGADIGTLEDQREYNVVQVNEASESLTDVADISYIILEETQ